MLTTAIGLALGAEEASLFVGRLLSMNTLSALLISKLFSVLLVVTAIRFKRARMVVFLNYWFAAVVSWNLIMILTCLWNR